ncbi:hypothetical protein, partial [Bartonella sp. AS69XJJH]|uniref:hypothetical protein n=1 Tax=Bartonella sp. AS69XJJH TaxID=3243508 RepID=UPI0035CF0B42
MPINEHQPFSPNTLHSPIPILTHFTIQPLHWHPLYPKHLKTLTALHQPQIPAITVPRFYDFANSQKTSKLPINRPIEIYHKSITDLSPAYYLPINEHQPFSPNTLHSPIPILTHFTIQPLHWHPLHLHR